MIVVNVSQDKAQLTKLLAQAERGHKVYISRRGDPIVELRLLRADSDLAKPMFGLCAGDFMVPDDFDAPLPEEMLSAFEGQ